MTCEEGVDAHLQGGIEDLLQDTGRDLEATADEDHTQDPQEDVIELDFNQVDCEEAGMFTKKLPQLRFIGRNYLKECHNFLFNKLPHVIIHVSYIDTV